MIHERNVFLRHKLLELNKKLSSKAEHAFLVAFCLKVNIQRAFVTEIASRNYKLIS